jgi:hypothetical protein
MIRLMTFLLVLAAVSGAISIGVFGSPEYGSLFKYLFLLFLTLFLITVIVGIFRHKK